MIKNINAKDLTFRKPDNQTKIYGIFSNPDAEMSIVKVECSGDHNIVMNKVSDRIYYILEGEGEVFFDGAWHPVIVGDCAYIEKGNACSIRGFLKGLIINSPPYRSGCETIVKE